LTTSLSAPPAGATQNTTNVADCTYIPVTNGTPTVLLPTGSVAASVEEPTGEPSSQGDILFAAAAEQVTVECKTASLPTSVGGQTVETTVVVETSPLGIVIDNNGNSVYESSCGADAASIGPAGCLSDGNAPSLVLAKFFTSPGKDGNGNAITCPSTDECVTFYLQATGDATFPFSAADSAAQCPPTAAQVNAGLTNCALAVFATTNTTTGAGTSVNANLLTYASQETSGTTNPLPTPAVPTLKLSPTSGAAGDTVTVSDASSPSSYWWSDAMYSDGFNSADTSGNGGGCVGCADGAASTAPLLASRDVPASDILIGSTPAASSSVVISPATYKTNVTGTCPGTTCAASGTLTDPAISGTFTLPSGLSAGVTTVTIYEPNNAFADGNVLVSSKPTGVTAGQNSSTPDISASATFTVSTPATVPGAPTGLGATAGNTTVALSWSAPLSNGGSAITGYNVFEGTSPGGEALTPVNSSLISGTTYTATGLTNGTKYYFTVKAVNAVGSSAASNEASATPATASGAPVAVNDHYYTPINTKLVVSAPGVLGNDTPNGANIVSHTNPAHGVLTLNANGSFTYSPRFFFVGIDSFTYTLQNSTGSSVGTVTIDVPARADLSVTLSAPKTTTPKSSFSYVMTVTNAGPDPAFGVTSSLFLPPWVKVISVSPHPSLQFPGLLGWSTATLAPSASVTFTVVVQVNGNGHSTLTALASVGARGSLDPNLANNTATANTKMMRSHRGR
jgi:hypothetical protein